MRNLTTHVNDVVNLVKWEVLKDIILVGHSSAGFVITQAAEQFGPSVISIVYLDGPIGQRHPISDRRFAKHERFELPA